MYLVNKKSPFWPNKFPRSLGNFLFQICQILELSRPLNFPKKTRGKSSKMPAEFPPNGR